MLISLGVLYIYESYGINHFICRPNFEQISKYLMELGGSVVISEEYLASHNTAGILNVSPRAC